MIGVDDLSLELMNSMELSTMNAEEVLRHDWTRNEIRDIHSMPLPDLLFRAQTIHRRFHDAQEVQMCRLISIKTGACPEDCGYCPQSAHYKTGVEREKLIDVKEVLDQAHSAKQEGATRFCMGAAWRQAPEGEEFDAVLAMVRGISSLGMEACCTLGMLTEDQAIKLKH